MLNFKGLRSIAGENRRLLTGLVSGIFIFAALIFGISYNLKRENEISQWVLQVQEEIYQIEKTISLAKDIETGSRGYLLTGSDDYELPLLEASNSLDATIFQLKTQAAKDKIQNQNLDSLTHYLEKKTLFSKNIIRLKREQGTDTAMAVFGTNVGKYYMDKIRYFADKMHQHANAELAIRKQENKTALQATNRILLTGIIIFVFLLVYAIWKSWQQQQERKLANRNLRIEKAFSEALLEASPDGMVGFDKHGNIVLFNHRAEKLFGYRKQELVNAPITTLMPNSEQLSFGSLTRQIARRKNYEMQVSKKDGTSFPADVRMSQLSSFKGEILIASVRDVSQRKAAELQLKESEKNLQAILSSSQEAIYLLDLDFRLVLLNDHSKTIIQQAYDVNCKPGDNFLNLFSSDLRPQLLAIYDQVLEGQKVDVERTFALEDGDAYYYSTYFPVKDIDGTIIGICCASKNITQRKKSEEAAQAANAEKEEYQSRFKAILDYSPQPILIKDKQGNEIFSNKAYFDLFAMEDAQDLHASLQVALDNTDALNEFTPTFDGDVSSLNSREWQQPVTLRNGQVLEMEIIKFPLYDRQKQLFGICTLFKDITEQIKHQEQLVAARENAEQAERLQEQFLANMSHELRTPMNGIIGMVNLLLTSSSLQPDQKGRLQIIKRSSDTLLNLINDILDLSKIKAGMLTIDHVIFDFNETIAGTAMMFREKAKEKSIKFAVSADPFIPRYLTGDPHRLNQILNNLLSNAIKFTEKGFVRMEASLLSETNEQAVVEFVVSDSGIGIGNDKLHYIFDNFIQESTDISSKYGGTGLGLAITKRLIELQGGTIEVESIKDKGTTFIFTIPYTIAQETANVAVTNYTLVPEVTRKKYQGKRALIVEDNDINQAVLNSTLQQYQLDVVIANNGQEAVDILQTGESFDIIFMDLRMPLMNGFQSTAYIRQTLKLQTPIVVLTASVLRNERDRCLEIGASDYMAKPFSISDLARTLERFIPSTANNTGTETAILPEQNNTTTKAFDTSRLLELKNRTYIKRILDLFTENMPVYLQELTILAEENKKTEFLEKAHKTKGSFSAIQIEEIYQLILDMEEQAAEQENLSVFVPHLLKCRTLYASLEPAIITEVEESLTLLEDNA